MKKTLKMPGIVLLTAIIGLSVGSCDDHQSTDSTVAPTQTPVVTDFDIGNLTQTVGSITAVTIMPKAGKSNGAITIYYNGSTTLPIEAGSYTVTFNVAATAGWNAANGLSGGTLTVATSTPVASDFDISGLTQYYDGNPKAVPITPQFGKSDGAITIYYEWTDGATYTKSTAAPSQAGVYTVTFDVAATTSWHTASGLSAGTFTIVMPIPVAADFNISGLTQSYDGNPKAVTITPKVGKSDGEITIYYTGTDGTAYTKTTAEPSGVGTYVVTFNVAATTMYNEAIDLNAGTLIVVASTPVAADFNIIGLTQYSDGSPRAVTVSPQSGKSNGAITVFYEWTDGITYTKTSVAPSAVGAYTVTFDVAAIYGYNAASGLRGGTLTINEAPRFSITFDTITDAAPSITGPTISRTGKGWPTTATITVDDPSQYSSILWRINGTIIGTFSSFALDWYTGYLSTGNHHLTVEVIKGGVPYNKTVIFTIAE